MCPVLALELQCEIEHRPLQKAAVGAELIGNHRSEFTAERCVEDAHVANRGIVLRLLPAVEACGSEESDGGRREYAPARRRQERAPSGEEMKCRL